VSKEGGVRLKGGGAFESLSATCSGIIQRQDQTCWFTGQTVHACDTCTASGRLLRQNSYDLMIADYM